MKFKFICCEVFFREACAAMAQTPHTVDPVFTPKGAHDNSTRLRKLIQDKIDETESGYDAILLGYGLCGNSTDGIVARSIPLVIPRAHDCCTIFLGSRQRFFEDFGNNLSAEWCSAGYMERGDSYIRESDVGKLLGFDKEYEDFVEQYGEENAKFIWETLHPQREKGPVIYINTPETSKLGFEEKARELAEKEGREFRRLEGDMRLLRNLLMGEWNSDEYLVVSPGNSIKAAYDNDRIFL